LAQNYKTNRIGTSLAQSSICWGISQIFKASTFQLSHVSGIGWKELRKAMNCRNCNTSIDYNYLKTCPQCGCEVESGNLPKLDPSLNQAKKNRVWLYLANFVCVFFTAAAGMITGAVTLYFTAGIIYMALQTPETYPGQHCGRGMAIGMLSIVLGAFLGTIGGTAFGVKHLINRGVATQS
jgi:hypothetical protein